MTPLNSRVNFPCPSCKVSIPVYLRPIIDSTINAELYHAFLDDKLNHKCCPSCGLKVDVPTPTAVLSPYWVSVALENPEPILARRSFEILEAFLPPDILENVSAERPLIVVGSVTELRRIIKCKQSDPFCSVPMAQMLERNWDSVVEMLSAMADGYLAHGRAADAYWLFSEAIARFSNIYFHPDIQERLELTALAAGDEIPSNLKEPRTATADLKQLKARYGESQPRHPRWWQDVYFCFFEKGYSMSWANKQMRMWSVVVKLQPLEPTGQFRFNKSERHLASVLSQAVAQCELMPFDTAYSSLMILLMASDMLRRCEQPPDDFNWLTAEAHISFHKAWKRMYASDRFELESFYQKQHTANNLRQDMQIEPDIKDTQFNHSSNSTSRQSDLDSILRLTSQDIEELEQAGHLTNEILKFSKMANDLRQHVMNYILYCTESLLQEDYRKSTLSLRAMFGTEAELRYTVPTIILDQDDISLAEHIKGYFKHVEDITGGEESVETEEVARHILENWFEPNIRQRIHYLLTESSSSSKLEKH